MNRIRYLIIYIRNKISVDINYVVQSIEYNFKENSKHTQCDSIVS